MDKEMKKSIRFNTMAVILIIIFSISIVPKTLQNDTFYTIKIGEYILENGVTMQEPFAWHENLEYTFPHWAYDVFIYIVYSIGGMTGIYVSTMVLSAILGLALYYVTSKLTKNRAISFIITIITMYLLKPYICARAQLVTFILFILTIYFIEKFLETRKIRYGVGLVIIPFLIANLHLATFYFYFILYLPYIAEYMIYILASSNVIISGAVVDSLKNKIAKEGETEELKQKLQKAEEKHNKLKEKQESKLDNPYKIKLRYRENTKWLVLIFIICFFTGLLTPLGDTPYTYLIKTMQGISTKNISEHLPLVLADNMKILVLFGVYIATIAFTKVKIKLADLFMIVGLSVLTLMTRRQASMLFLVGCVILSKLILEIFSKEKKDTLKTLEDYSSGIIGMITITLIILIISIFQYKPKLNSEYIDENKYPVQAAAWIKENLDIEKIKLYNEYNFGSYLLYQDIPVFIDSRCDLYMPEFNEGMYAFRDFLNLNSVSLNNMEEKIEEYGFTHFIVSKNVRFKTYLQNNKDKYVKIYPTEGIEDNNFTIFERVDKWKKII